MTDSRSERHDQSNVPGLGSEGPRSHSADLDIEALTAAEVTNSLGHGPAVTYVTNQLLTSGHVRLSPLVLTGGIMTGSGRPMATADIQRSIAVGSCSAGWLDVGHTVCLTSAHLRSGSARVSSGYPPPSTGVKRRLHRSQCLATCDLKDNGQVRANQSAESLAVHPNG